MPELRRIRSRVELAMSEEARAADDPRELSDISEAIQTEVVRADIAIEELDELVDHIRRTHKQYDAGIDAAMAVRLHQILSLTRREAADRYLWAWLGFVRYPHLVAWRWRPQAGSGLRTVDRFVGNRVRQTFARLWWAAELTLAPGSDYALTKRLLELRGFQDVYEAIFGRAFCQYLPALSAFVEVVGPKPEEVVRETAKEFGYLLTTLVLEALSEIDLRSILQELAERVEARRKGELSRLSL